MQTSYNQLIEKPFLSTEDVDIISETLAADGYTDLDIRKFIALCNKTQLHPLTNQVYATKRDGKLVPVVGIEGLIWCAERTGNYDGCELAWAEDKAGEDGEPFWLKAWLPSRDYPALARAIVKHKQHSLPEVAHACWGAYAAVYKGEYGRFWKKMPDLMLGKCALALALRRAFPNQIGGLYTPEEMEKSDAEQTYGKSVVPVKTAPPIDDEEKELREEAKKLPPRDYQLQRSVTYEKKAEQRQKPPVEVIHSTAPKGNDDKDDIDLSPDRPAQAEVSPTQPEAEPEPEPALPAWKDHVILTIGTKEDPRFRGRKMGGLSFSELELLRGWLTKVEGHIANGTGNISDERKLDAAALREAFAAKEMEKLV